MYKINKYLTPTLHTNVLQETHIYSLLFGYGGSHLILLDLI